MIFSKALGKSSLILAENRKKRVLSAQGSHQSTGNDGNKSIFYLLHIKHQLRKYAVIRPQGDHEATKYYEMRHRDNHDVIKHHEMRHGDDYDATKHHEICHGDNHEATKEATRECVIETTMMLQSTMKHVMKTTMML